MSFLRRMAFFRRTKQEQERLDWRLLRDGAVTLYHKAPILAEDAAWFRQHGYCVYEFDARGWDTAQAFYRDAKRVLELSAHYAPNLASLIDCLAEMEVPDEGGALLQFRGYDAFAARERELAQTVLDVLETTSRGFLLTGRRFVALVQCDNPRVSFERVGARPVNWNPREWLQGNRGAGGDQPT